MARFSALSAAVVALAFSSQVAGQAALDPCVQKSIRDAGCGPTDIKCMCKGAAEGNFLTDVLTSMVQYCPNTVDASGLFSQLSGGCKSAGFQIPPKNIADAQQLAGSVFSGGSGSGSDSGSAAGGSATTNQPSGTPKPTPMITAGAGLPVSQPSVIGESTAVISTGGAAASNGSLIVAPSATPKPNAGSGSNSGSSSGGSSSSSSGDSTGSGSTSGNTSGTSSSQSSSTSGKPENAGVRSTASLGAAVIGLAAAVMMW